MGASVVESAFGVAPPPPPCRQHGDGPPEAHVEKDMQRLAHLHAQVVEHFGGAAR